MSAQLDLIEVAAIDQAMETMRQRLWPSFGQQPWQIQIFLADEGMINAFALPGGTLVFHSGLIFAAKTAEKSRGLAHEIARVTHRHSLHGIADSVGIVLAAQLLLGDVSGVVV